MLEHTTLPSKIEIGTVEAMFGMAVILVGAGVAWGILKGTVNNIDKVLDKDIKPELKDFGNKLGKLIARVSVVEDRVEVLWKDRMAPTASPRQLNDLGKNVLTVSGVKEIIENNKEDLTNKVRKKKPSTPYDAERVIMSVIEKLPKYYPDTLPKLKDGAFRSGEDLDTVLFVGGIHLRNLIFEDLGFSLKDLDQTQS